MQVSGLELYLCDLEERDEREPPSIFLLVSILYSIISTFGKMGCGASKEGLQTVDDSVHVMLKHDKKVAQKKGEAPKGYVPRAPHPLLQKQEGEGQAADNANGTEQAGAPKPIVASEE
ncbi:expressed unknown protein [Seminavis robusta]|uniref:Uncharacterized protein n=1 Tax=Seminavis robusta TaxID=568900 RepID=A0A9N8E2H9_9STRA|nr:expressed unknown protein [Seminavis robusta]|eukprot:Sro440_g143340.1 n/a (118) ;mRNA; r:7775-8514